MARKEPAPIRNGLYLGLMSGTSVDGIDAALVRLRGDELSLAATVVAHHQQAWPIPLRRRLLAVMAPARAATAEICELNMLTAREFAAAANKLVKTSDIDKSKIIAIGSHGQTICHLPPSRDRASGSTLQIGDNTVIAAITGICTVGNFRPADMVIGGQGAPLVPLVDKLLLTDRQHIRCVQNLGGIGNVTCLPPRGSPQNVIAFDTGPANMLMDALVTLSTNGRMTYDCDGRLAAQGRIYRPMLRKLQSIPYFQLPPPKSTGRELFGESLAGKILKQFPGISRADLLATALELTAWSIGESYRRFLPQVPHEVIVCGGGAENPVLMARLATYLRALGCRQVCKIDDLGILNQAKEALAFAVLAALTLQNIPGNLPSATGAVSPVVLGSVARVGG
jgi:anhydro-N-acetylmuramic acid kinase